MERKNRYLKRNRGRKKTNEKRMLCVLIAYAFGMALSLTGFVGTTQAWFTDDMTISSRAMQSAFFDLTISVTGTDESECKQEKVSGKYIFQLKAQSRYSVILNADGNASCGYCVISDGTDTWYTSEIYAGKSMSFTINTGDCDMEYSFEPHWGSYKTVAADQIILADGSIGAEGTNSFCEDKLPAEQISKEQISVMVAPVQGKEQETASENYPENKADAEYSQTESKNISEDTLNDSSEDPIEIDEEDQKENSAGVDIEEDTLKSDVQAESEAIDTIS